MIYFMHKGTKTIRVSKWPQDKVEEYLNAGWVPGKCPAHWITNGEENKLLPEGLPLPEGYRYGQSEEFKHKNSLGNKRRWKELSDADKKILSDRVSAGVKRLWDSMSEEERLSREQNRINTRNQWDEETKKALHDTLSKAAIANRKTITKEEYRIRSIKSTATKKENHTFPSSSYEETVYKLLCEEYGQEDITREYVEDERYPYKCDFHIRSIDLFLELNIHPSHNDHRYDESNEDDLRARQELELMGDDWSKMILDVWCHRDVEKVQTATRNNLNYLTIYKKDFNDFIENIKHKRL